MRLLLIEDEVLLRQQLAKQLEQEGYRVDQAGDGKTGLYNASEYPCDLAIVDLGLPQLSGLELIRRLRADGSKLPILILTARGRWQEKVEGLEAGADDYLTKPFEFPELLARIKALLRRSAGAPANVLLLGPFRLDLAAQKLSRNGVEVELTTFEYRLLEYLIQHRGTVVAKATLSDYLYPHDEDRDSNVLEVLIGRLRKKLDPDGSLQPIETLRGRGYSFTLQDNAG
ncbi:MAG: response regulator transcription factor [Chitinivorax sp.]